MIRTSGYLNRLNLLVAQTALAGEPFPVDALPALCGILTYCASQCAEMEARLAGADLSGPNATTHSNIISLAAWLDARRERTTPPGNGAA